MIIDPLFPVVSRSSIIKSLVQTYAITHLLESLEEEAIEMSHSSVSVAELWQSTAEKIAHCRKEIELECGEHH